MKLKLMERLVWRQVTIPKGLSSILELICKETIRHDPECMYSFIADLLEREYEEETASQQRRPNEGETEETHLLGKEDNNESAPSPTTPISSLEDSEGRSALNSPREVLVVPNEPALTPTIQNAEVEVGKSPEVPTPSKSPEVPKSPISTPVVTPTKIDVEEIKAEAEKEIDKILEQSLDTKEIQELLESGDFQNLSVAEDESEEDADGEEEDEEEEEEEYEDEQPVVVIDRKKVVESEEEDDYEEEEEEEEENEEQEDEEEEKIKRNLEALMSEDVEVSKSDSELNDAAVKIQAGFRGYQARKNMRKEPKDEGKLEVKLSGSAPASPIRSATAGDESLEEEEEDEVPVPVPRRRPGSERVNRKAQSAKYRSGMVFNNPEEPDEILGYDDDYLNKAATRIQANVRGWMTRKDLEKRSDGNNDKKRAATKIQATVRGFLTRRRLAKAKLANRRRSSNGLQLKQRRKSSLKLDQAATRIQAAFRGYNVRKGKKSKRSETGKSTPASPTVTTMTPPPLVPVAPTPTDTSAPSIGTSLQQDDE